MEHNRDPHLNIFRFFNESSDAHYIENNLSRAFAICLEYDLTFFSEFLHGVLEQTDYSYLFAHYSKDSEYYVNLQINTSDIEVSGIRVLYAIAMTANPGLSMDGFGSHGSQAGKESNTTDIWILVKDIIIVIEVKRSWEDCKQQLYNQVQPLIQKNHEIQLKSVAFSWQNALQIMERVANMRLMRQDHVSFLGDFLTLCEGRYPEWFPTQPFYHLPGLRDMSEKTVKARDKRLRQIITQSGHEILGYHDRLAIACRLPWASEIIPLIRSHGSTDYINFLIWPGNTKTQGYYIYGRGNLEWTKKPHLRVGDSDFELDTVYHMKFSHFSRYVSHIEFSEKDLLKAIYTPDNFYSRSGKWDTDRWEQFEEFMDEYFKPEFNWRNGCGWEEKFLHSERSYFTVSFGFETELWIEYERFREIDRLPNDFSRPVAFVNEIVTAFGALLD
jgi:hypothetical protein